MDESWSPNILAIIEKFNTSKKIFLEVLVTRTFVLPPPATNQNTPESSQPYLKSDTTTICLITPKPD
jgi:hypothetical protein